MLRDDFFLLEEEGIQLRLKSLIQVMVLKYLSGALQVPDHWKPGQCIFMFHAPTEN